MGFFTGIFALISGIVAAFLSVTISRMLKEKVVMTAGFAAFFGVVTWAIGAFSTKVPVLALLLLIFGLVAVAVLVIRWHFEGSKTMEFICFGVLSLVLMLANLQAAAVVAKWVETIPKVVFILSLAYFAFDTLKFKLRLEKAESAESLDKDVEYYENPLGILKEKFEETTSFIVEEPEILSEEDFADEEPINFGLDEERGEEYVS